MIDKLAQMGIVPEDKKEIVTDKYIKRLNFIKIIPEKVILLYLRPDKTELKKIWENGKAYGNI